MRVPRGAVSRRCDTISPGPPACLAHFRTPVTLEDVLVFYHARARAAGFTSAREIRGEEEVLRGERGDEQFAVYARRGPGTSAEIDLVTIGG